MYRKTECVTMLLAGGQGSRLGVLTKNRAKPAVHFGGKYRLIDFALSNCANSGISTVGILTQYEPLELTEYIGRGNAWDLDRRNGGVHILSPYRKAQGGDWYKGTANAIYQHMDFIDRYNPEYVLILGCDHVYKMDYSKMLEFHKQSGADCTIAVTEVPPEKAHEFGILDVQKDHLIVDFEEKPKRPKSTNASMGIYIFNWKKLKKFLELDNRNLLSDNDFGKNIIPLMLTAGEKMSAYPFSGYWRDVGTIESLWSANMDILGAAAKFDIYDRRWRIFTGRTEESPGYFGDMAKVCNSIVAEGCIIEGSVYSSILFPGVKVAKGAVIRDSVIFPGAVIGNSAAVKKAIVGERAEIGENASVGLNKSEIIDFDAGITVVGDRVKIGSNVTVLREMVENDIPDQAPEFELKLKA